MRPIVFALTALSITVTACQRPQRVETCPEITALGARNAVTDAAAAFKRSDKRLLALGGYSPTVPGAEGSDGFYHFRKGTEFRELEGTRDTATQACSAVLKIAEKYASSYNREMMILTR